MAAINAEPETMRFVGEGLPYDRATSDEQLAKWRTHWEDFGYGLFATTLRDGGELIGFAGVMQPFFMPEVMPSNEIGWRLARRHTGRGYATEAAIAARDWAIERVGPLISIIRPENTASVRVAEKIGMSLDRMMDHPVHGWPLSIYTVSGR